MIRPSRRSQKVAQLEVDSVDGVGACVEICGEGIRQSVDGLRQGDAARCEASVFGPDVVVERAEAVCHGRWVCDPESTLLDEVVVQEKRMFD